MPTQKMTCFKEYSSTDIFTGHQLELWKLCDISDPNPTSVCINNLYILTINIVSFIFVSPSEMCYCACALSHVTSARLQTLSPLQ